jgi:hypothetical protein
MRRATLVLAGLTLALAGTRSAAQQPARPAAQPARDTTHHDSVTMDPRAHRVAHIRSAFGPDPSYPEAPYDYQAQLDIYGAKHMNRTQRPLLELGREMYHSGPFRPAGTALGKHNILIPQLLVYGDVRSAAGSNQFFDPDGGPSVSLGTWGNRLNLDVDLKITASERIHALFRPFEKDGRFTRFDFQVPAGDSTGFKDELDIEPAALFFEGDFGAIVGGLTRRDAPFDLPISAGLMPLLFQNGVWIEDAFIGGAFAIPARNSKSLDWSNFDISFFYGGDKVSNPTVGSGADNGQIAGATAFIEAKKGYLEVGYASVFGAEETGGRDFQSIAVSFTRRYRGRVSNSVRYIGAIGTDTDSFGDANGHLLLIENSLITSKPSTQVPYLNLFFGYDSPVSAARDPGAGGILKNTGLNFESDAITGFPSLDPTAHNAAGGALGLNLLGGNLNRQLVLEVAATYPWTESVTLPGAQYGVGLRIQEPLTNAMILRIDGIYGIRELIGNISGVRLELRYKL